MQYHDSQIAEKILKRCKQDGVYVLPIHDSFIVQAAYESYLKDLMVHTLLEHFECGTTESMDKDLLVKVIKGIEVD